MYELGVPTEVLTLADEFHTGATEGEPALSPRPLASALVSMLPPPCFISFLNLDRLF